MRFPVAALLAGLCLAAPAAAQSSADSAAIVLDAARTLQRDGRIDAARQLLQLIRTRYGATPAARAADSILATFTRQDLSASGGTGRTGFILFHTIYGAFLGVAIPAAFDAKGSEPYGAGLLIGAPLGYFGSRAFARPKITMSGQAGIASFATLWGTWQGLAIQQVADIGDREVCSEFGCFNDGSDTAPWAAMVAGGLAGLGTGLVLASRPVASGTSTLISHSAFWGSWFGVSLGGVFGAEDDNLLGATLAGGDAALLLAIPAAKAWRPSSSQVRLTTAAGIAGGLAGFGIDLLTNENDRKVVLGIPLATSALGLVVGAVASRGHRGQDGDDGAAETLALLTIRDGIRLRLPLPMPTAIPTDAGRNRRWRPGLRIALLDADF